MRDKTKGSIYQMVMVIVDAKTLEPSVVYTCQTTGATFCIPASEFFGGRFEVVFKAEAQPVTGQVH